MNRRRYNTNKKSTKRRAFKYNRSGQEGTMNKPRTIIALNFVDTVVLGGGSGSDYANKQFRANSAYDPDPSVLSQSVGLFSQYAAMYNYYRVHHVDVVVKFDNVDTFASVAYLGASRTATTPTSVDQIKNLIEKNGYRMNTLQPVGSGNSKIQLRATFKGTQVVGAREYLTDKDFAALVTTNPADMWYINFGVFDMYGTNTYDNGVVTTIKLRYHTMFYGRKDILDDSYLVFPLLHSPKIELPEDVITQLLTKVCTLKSQVSASPPTVSSPSRS